MFKKVIKKFNKSLYVLLTAAMVVGSTPDVCLTASAAELDTAITADSTAVDTANVGEELAVVAAEGNVANDNATEAYQLTLTLSNVTAKYITTNETEAQNITYPGESNGTVYSNAVSVEASHDVYVYLKPDTGYKLPETITGLEAVDGQANVYKVTGAPAGEGEKTLTITVAAEAEEYDVTVSKGENISTLTYTYETTQNAEIPAEGKIKVKSGETVTFNVTAAEGHKAQVSVDGGEAQDVTEGTFTTGTITAATTVAFSAVATATTPAQKTAKAVSITLPETVSVSYNGYSTATYEENAVAATQNLDKTGTMYLAENATSVNLTITLSQELASNKKLVVKKGETEVTTNGSGTSYTASITELGSESITITIEDTTPSRPAFVAKTVSFTENNDVTTEFVPGSVTDDNKTIEGKDVEFKVALKQEAAEAHKAIKSVKYKTGAGEGEGEALTEANGKYTIPARLITGEGDITITVETEQLYAVSLDKESSKDVTITLCDDKGVALESPEFAWDDYLATGEKVYFTLALTEEAVAADKEIKDVTIGGVKATADKNGVYTITVAGADASVKVTTAAKEYSITLPTTCTGITAVKYAKVAADAEKPAKDAISAASSGTAITATKGEKIYFVIESEKDYKVKVTYPAVDAESKSVTKPIEPDTNGIYEYIVTGTETSGLTITATATELVDVTFAALPKGVTVKYSNDQDAAAEDFEKLDTLEAADPESKKDAVLGIKNVGVGEKIYLMITTAEGTLVKSVTATSGSVTKVDDLYEYTVAKSDTITVAVDDSKVLTFTRDANVKGLYYAESDTAFDTDEEAENTAFKAVPGDGKVEVLKDSKVYLYVDVNENYEIDSVKIGDDALEVTTNGNYEVTADDAKTVAVTTKKTEFTFNFAFDSTKVKISNTSGAAVESEGAVTATHASIVMYKGDVFSFNVEAIVETIKAITVTEAPTAGGSSSTVKANLNNPDAPYSVKADAAKTITVEVENYRDDLTVTFSGDANTKSVTPTVAGTAKDAVNFTEGSASVTNITEESEFSFTLEAKNKYAIDEVRYSVGDVSNKLLLPDENGVYTIPGGITGNVSVTVTTTPDAKQLNTVTFSGSDIDNVIITNSTGTTSETITDLTKAYITDAKEIYFKITPAKNYTVKEVREGTTVLTKEEGKEIYKLTLADLAAEEKKVDKSITITTEAAEAAEAQKVEFDVPNNCVLAVTTSGVTKDANGVYTVPKTVKELEFTVAVPYGDKVYSLEAMGLVAGANTANTVKQVGKRVLAANKRTWTYTYKVVVANLNTAEYVANINVYTAQDTINVSVYEDSTPLRMRAGAWTEDNMGQDYDAGETLQNVPVNENVYVEIDNNRKLYTVTFDAVGDPVFTEVKDIDKFGVYKFTAVPDGNVTLYGEWTGDYFAASIYDGPEKPYIYIDGELDVDYNTDLTFALEDGRENISKVLVKAGESEAASKATISKDEKYATVVFDEKDAGKKLSIELYTILDEATTTEEILAATVTVNVAPLATKAEIKGVKNNGTVKLGAATTTSYDLKLTPASITTSLLDVTVDDKNDAEAAKIAKIVDNKLVINTPAKAEKHVIAIIDKTVKTTDGKNKTLLTFTVESVLPTLKLSKLESPAQGTKDIIITLTGDKAIKVTNENAALFYEVTVTPAEGKAPDGSVTKTVYIPYDSTVTKSIEVNTVTDRTKDTKWDYTFDARIVMVDTATAATLASASTKLADDKVIAATAKAVSKKFSTRNAYYEDKLGVTKKTTKIYSGQTAIAAIVKYSKKASDLHIDAGDALVYNTNGTLASGFTVSVDPITDEVSVTVDKYVSAGKYNLVLYAKAENSTTTNDMYQASATVPLTVVNGINYIVPTYPNKVVVAGNKNITIKTKTTGYKYYGYNKAATQKFKYELVTRDDGEHGAIDSRLVDYLSINANSGVITVKKGIPLSKDLDHNGVIVKISAADYAGNDAVEYAYVQLTDEKIEIAEVYLALDQAGYKKLPTTLTAAEANYAYVIAIDKDGKKIDSSDITITSSNKKAAGVAYNEYSNDHIIVLYGAAKNVTFKVTANDGGKSSKTSAKYTFSALKTGTVTAKVPYDDGFVQTSDKTFTYKGSRSFWLKFYSDGNRNPINSSYYNYTVSVKGGKIYNYSDCSYVTPTAKETIVSFTDKETKKKTEFTFTNTAYVTAKAPAAKITGTLYTYLRSAEDGSAIPQNLSFRLTKPNTEKYEAVQVSLTSAPKNGSSPIEDDIYDINQNGGFDYYVDEILTVAGTYKYSAVYGKYNEDREFVPMTKAGTVSVKVTKSADVKPVTSYKMNLKNSKSVALTAKPEYAKVKFTKIQNANVGGKANAFLTYFVLDNNKLTLKAGVDVSKIEKKDLTGYVTYQYYIGAGLVEKQAKITVSFDTKAAKYTATGITVLNAATAEGTTTIKLGNTPVSIQSVKASEGWSAAAVAPGVVKLTATAEPGVGKKKVTLSIVTTDSFYTDATAAATDVTVNVTVVDPAKAKMKLDSKKSVIDLSKEEGAWDTSNVAKWIVVREAGTAYKFTSLDVKISTATLDESATDVMKAAVTVAKVADTNDIQFTILNKSLVNGNIPVKVEFANGAAEVVNFKLVTAKIATLDEVAATVKAQIAALNTTEVKANDEAAVTAILNKIDVVTGIDFKDVAVTITPATETTAASSKVTYTLFSKADATKTKAEEVTLKAKATTVAKLDAEAAYTALAAQVNNLVATEVAAADQGKKLQVTKDTTPYQIRTFLQKAIENSDYTVAVYQYEITVDPTTSAFGTATFKYQLVNKTAVGDKVDASISVAKLPATETSAQ